MAFRWKTTERRIGIIGPRWSGKTVFLTSLINHLKFHDPGKFTVGPRDQPAEIAQFQEQRDRADSAAFPWFDYEGYRNQFVQHGQWPATTKDCSRYVCEFERSDWKLNKTRLYLFDLPGERVNDIPMLAGGTDAAGYNAWSDLTYRRIAKDLQTAIHFQPYFDLLALGNADAKALLTAYKTGLAKARLAYRPYLTPSTFLLDRHGQRIRGNDPGTLAQSRYCGLSAEEEFCPIPAEYRGSHPGLVSVFSSIFSRYTKEIVVPVVEVLKSCHSLVVVVDVLAILGHGTGMYNDYRQLVADLITALEPKENPMQTVWRHVSEAILPSDLQPAWISRLAFVAPKIDRIPFEDRARVKGLMEQLVRHEAKRCRGVKIDYFALAAVVGARELRDSQREMIGCTLYDADGTPLAPGAERKFKVPAIPDTWPESGWAPGELIYPDVYPKVSPLSNCPTEQSGLDDVFNFVCW